MRSILVRWHRWVGLAMALFLVIAGLTGSIIAFTAELDEWLNPGLYRAGGTGAPLTPYELAARFERDNPRARVTHLPLAVVPGRAIAMGISGRPDLGTGKAHELGYNEVFLDPTSGTRLGSREWSAFRVDRAHLIPFLYTLHYSLHLPERWGLWFMGLVALAWALDCFVGLWLTFPRGRPFLGRWRRSWSVKGDRGAARFNFDLHRAGGLWLWGLLLMLAVSSVYLNLPFDLFRPALSLVVPITPAPLDPGQPRRAVPLEPRMSFEEIVMLASAEGARRGWALPSVAFLAPEKGVYGVLFGDRYAPGVGAPNLYYDDQDGRIVGEDVPGEGTAGDVFMQWMLPLHSGRIIGLPGRVLICFTGLAVAALSVTGIVVWARKRRGPASAPGQRRSCGA
jgi:uncharacterized iron-regulated membrane protein